MEQLEVCSEEWAIIHGTDRQMLQILMQAQLSEEGVLFADVPVYFTHTFMLSEDDPEGFNPSGVRPFRYFMLSFSEFNLQVGVVVGDITTRADLMHKAIAKSPLLPLLAGP